MPQVEYAQDAQSYWYAKLQVSRNQTLFFFFSRRRRHTRYWRDWSSDVCSSDLGARLTGPDCYPLTPAALCRESMAAAGDMEFDCTRSEERRVGKECRSRWSP